jgi:hypothetical protein
MFGILHSSGWISILLGVLQLLVGAEAVMGDQLARWPGVALLTQPRLLLADECDRCCLRGV